jgi:hypothetical protein
VNAGAEGGRGRRRGTHRPRPRGWQRRGEAGAAAGGARAAARRAGEAWAAARLGRGVGGGATRARRGRRAGGARGVDGARAGVGLNFRPLLYVAQHANEKNRGPICMLGWSCSNCACWVTDHLEGRNRWDITGLHEKKYKKSFPLYTYQLNVCWDIDANAEGM